METIALSHNQSIKNYRENLYKTILGKKYLEATLKKYNVTDVNVHRTDHVTTWVVNVLTYKEDNVGDKIAKKLFEIEKQTTIVEIKEVNLFYSAAAFCTALKAQLKKDKESGLKQAADFLIQKNQKEKNMPKALRVESNGRHQGAEMAGKEFWVMSGTGTGALPLQSVDVSVQEANGEYNTRYGLLSLRVLMLPKEQKEENVVKHSYKKEG